MARREVEGGGGHGYGSNHPQDLHMKVSIQIRILLLKDNYGIMVDVFFCFYLGIWGRGRGGLHQIKEFNRPCPRAYASLCLRQ